jgi:hypothetical protein
VCCRVGDIDGHCRRAKEHGYEIDRRKIVLREPIKRFGSYTVPVRLHREVTLDLPVSVLGEGGVEVKVEARKRNRGRREAYATSGNRNRRNDRSG